MSRPIACESVRLDPCGALVWNGIIGVAEAAVTLRTREAGRELRESLSQWPKSNRAWLAAQLRFVVRNRLLSKKGGAL